MGRGPRLHLGAGPAQAFVRRAWDRFRRGVRRAWDRVSDRVRRGWRRVKDGARRALDAARNTAKDLVGRAARLAKDAASRASRLARAAAGRAREIGRKVADAAKRAVERAREIGARIKGAVASAIAAARRAAEAAAAAARRMLDRMKGFASGLAQGEVEVPVWPKPKISCRIKIKSPGSSIDRCVNKVARAALKVLPWLKQPLEFVAQVKDKAQGYAVGLFSCVKNMVKTGVKEAGRLVTQLVRDPLGTIKGLFTGAFRFLSSEAGPLLKLFDPRPLLKELLAILPPPKQTAKRKDKEGKEVTDLKAQSKEHQRTSATGLLMSIAGPLAAKAVKFADTMPDKIWATIERWRAKLARRGIKAPFACLPLIKRAFNDFKGPIMTVVKAVLAKTKDVVQLIAPVADKIVNQVLEIAVGILSGTKLFQQIKGAVTVAFVDSAGMISQRVQRVKELLSGAARDPEAQIHQLAKDVFGAIPFLKLTFWVQLIKDPIKDKITEKLIAVGNEVIDFVMSAIRAELFNLLNRLIDWASETIPYASYVLADLGPVIMWIVRVAWDKVIDPIIRAIAQKVVSTVVTYSVDLAVEFAAAVIREGTTRLDKLIKDGVGTAIDKIPVPGPLKGIIGFVLKIYKQYIEPQINRMQYHLNALGGFMQLLAGVVPGEEDDEGGGDGGGEGAPSAGAMATRPMVRAGAPRPVSRTPGRPPAGPGATAPSPVQVSRAFTAAYRALARDRGAGLRALGAVGGRVARQVAPPRRVGAARALAVLRGVVSRVFGLVARARAAVLRSVRRLPRNAAAALSVLGRPSPVPRGAQPLSVLFGRFSDAARRYLRAAGMLAPRAAALSSRAEGRLRSGAAALGQLKAVGGVR